MGNVDNINGQVEVIVVLLFVTQESITEVYFEMTTTFRNQFDIGESGEN